MSDIRYTKNGEWIQGHGPFWRVGYAKATAEELGEMTFIQLPEIGMRVAAGEVVCAVEAVKAAADFYAPVAGRVTEVNQLLVTRPELVNESPEGDGWIFSLSEVSENELQDLLDVQAWRTWEAGL